MDKQRSVKLCIIALGEQIMEVLSASPDPNELLRVYGLDTCYFVILYYESMQAELNTFIELVSRTNQNCQNAKTIHLDNISIEEILEETSILIQSYLAIYGKMEVDVLTLGIFGERIHQIIAGSFDHNDILRRVAEFLEKIPQVHLINH